ncbi:MAG: RecQ family ATP-dependent DNA helicase [Bacteroidaceae bacterium]|nr:RecQ family ATP-dependent DNA helicase [Bacteroidaceae bacterium]
MTHGILKKYWGYDNFRGIQEEIIKDLLAGKDVLGLMPTGGGKSICFQVPALAMEGVCVVISPLIALMKDQVENLKRRHIRSAAIYSGMSHQTVLQTLENAVYGGLKILYVSPERLESDLFIAKLSHMNVSFFTVDEAHCICQWGYDFRPSYLNISKVRKIHPKAPVLALTATAPPAVADDIQEKLLFVEKNCKGMSFRRDNISYIVELAEDKLIALMNILNETPGSAIVYVSSREKTTQVAEILRQAGITAEAYNAGLTDIHRDVRQKKWTDDRARVMVATNAFGMGIDKADVRVVVHIDVPTSIEAYFQEAGRAGRDGQPAKAILLVSAKDKSVLRRKIETKYPEEEYIKKIYELVCCFYEIGEGYGESFSAIFDIEKFCRAYGEFPVVVESALSILNNAGYLMYNNGRDSLSRVRFIVNRDDLYEMPELPESLGTMMQALLRNYTGLFTSYVSIMEERLEEQTALSADEVYASLLELSRRGVIRYIPKSKKPLITFSIDRVRDVDFFLPDSCHKTLKERFTERVDAVISYISNNMECRSAQLLRYFGENNTNACLQCDVCRKKGDISLRDTNGMRRHILKKLSDGKLHHISELFVPESGKHELMDEIKSMLSEELIVSKGPMLTMKRRNK